MIWNYGEEEEKEEEEREASLDQKSGKAQRRIHNKSTSAGIRARHHHPKTLQREYWKLRNEDESLQRSQ